LIKLRGIERTYRGARGEVCALCGIDMDIAEGEMIAVTGASGSGKSTLMNIIGLLDSPTGGRYSFNGREVSHLTGREKADIRLRDIGFVFQSFRLLPRLTARENVELAMQYAGIDRDTRRKRSAELLRIVGLSDRMEHLPSELSGGQAQRVAIARALANSPRILLADQPTGNLDPARGREILELFQSLNEGGITVVLITHDPDAAAAAKRRIELKHGRIACGDI